MQASEDRLPRATTGTGVAGGASPDGVPALDGRAAAGDAARPAAENDPFALPKAPVRASPPAGGGDARDAPFRTGPWREVRRLAAIPGPPRERRRLVLLAAGIALVLVANMFAAVRLNAWQGGLFDAIDRRGLSAFGQQLVVFAEIMGALVVLVVAQTWMQEMLKVRLREWLTDRLLDAWMAPGRAYRLAMTSEFGVNPDQRIQEDNRHLTQLTVDLGVGLLYSTLLLVSFVGVLWSLSSG
jgi:ABC-type uncharacterized transport system fused permease/ATPase subunit